MTELSAESVVLCDVIGCSWGHTVRSAPDTIFAEVEWLRQRQRATAEEHRKSHAHMAEVIDGPLKHAMVAYAGNEPSPHVDVMVTPHADVMMPPSKPYPLRLYRFTIADPSGKPIGYVFSTQNGYLAPEVLRTINYNDWVHADQKS